MTKSGHPVLAPEMASVVARDSAKGVAIMEGRRQGGSGTGNSRGARHSRRSIRQVIAAGSAALFRFAFGSAAIAALVLGWAGRSEEHIVASEGLGYWLGIAGASAMLLLLVYPMRKRIRGLRVIGSVRFWFAIHMTLGILGPVLILYHCNFSLGSLNSNVALFTMLTVATSGLAGRYLHGKIHRRLDGRRIEVAALMDDLDAARRDLGPWLGDDDTSMPGLARLAETAAQPATGLIAGMWRLVQLRSMQSRARSEFMQTVRRALAEARKPQGWSRRAVRRRERSLRDLLNAYLASVDRVARFSVFDRLFALWHVLHMPLFVLLVLSVVVHVVGVHLY